MSIAMGKRKFRLGRVRKNEERKRQALKRNMNGRPRKLIREVHTEQIPTVLDNPFQALQLPPQWVARSSGETKAFCKIENLRGSPEVSCSITVNPDNSWKVFAFGNPIDPRRCSVLEDTTSILDLHSLASLLQTLDDSRICAGHPDSEFVSLLEKRRSKSISCGGHQSAYLDESIPVVDVNGTTVAATIRSTSCEIITRRPLRCVHCMDYRNNLRAMRAKQKSGASPTNRVVATSHTNYRYLHSPEKTERLRNLQREKQHLSRKVAQLKKQIKKVTESHGLSLTKDLSDDLSEIVRTSDISQAHEPGTFARVFWDQQKEALGKNPKQMRWHPTMVKWCIHLRMLSPSCYRSFRSSGVLHLPSERTLRDYTNIVSAKSGIQPDVDKQLSEETKPSTSSPHEKLVALLFDEVKIKEDLVYNKITGDIVGFVNISEITNHLTQLEESMKSSRTPKLATHMLVVMVRGVCSSLKFPYAQFPVSAATCDIMCPIIWDCVEHLEMIGLKVIAFVCDGAASNRKFMKMFREGKDEITFKIKNVYADEDRPIFLISDVPHLLKTARNSWANSHAHSNSRNLKINGKCISWQHLLRLFERHCSVKHTTPGLSILPKLKYEHLHLNSYSKMRVDLAAQVLSKSVADAFSLEHNHQLSETERFVRNFNRFFDCMNVRSYKECIYKRKPDVRPYRSADDPRLTWLEVDFLSYFQEWEDSLDGEEEKEKCMIARETRLGLSFTVKSMVGLIRYCLGVDGVQCVLTEHLCQDPLEAFFGRQRMSCGRSDNPSVHTFLHNTVSLRVQGSAAMQPFRGNIRRKKKKRRPIPVDNTPLPKRPRYSKK